MRYRESIWIEKLDNMSSGIKHATDLLETLSRIIPSENIGREAINNEVENIHDLLVWVRDHGVRENGIR